MMYDAQYIKYLVTTYLQTFFFILVLAILPCPSDNAVKLSGNADRHRVLKYKKQHPLEG